MGIFDSADLTNKVRAMSTLKFALVTILLFECMSHGRVFAQTTTMPSPKEPTPAHERLRFFEGTWTTTDSKPEDAFRETCAWLPEGRRHMVCRWRMNTTSGLREGMSVFSFDSKTGRYIYSGFRASGAFVSLNGEEHNGLWLFTSDQGVGAARLRTRVVIKPRSDEGFDFRSETSTGDDPWADSASVVYKRIAQ